MRCRALTAWMVLAVILCSTAAAEACTTAVVTGAATANGRSLLWKNRDASDKNNQVVYATDGLYAYLGIVNGGDAAGQEIWGGVNDKGFAIMNNNSYNLNGGEETKGDGFFMKLALQSCATVADFQALLDKTEGKNRELAANFGVLDAQGGAAYFEVGAKGYTRYDASAAPAGWLVRTNYGDSADRKYGAGFTRRARGEALMGGLVGAKRLTAQSLLSEVCRDTANANIGSFPAKGLHSGAPRFAYTADSVCRFDTASAFVLVGVKPGEDPRLSTLWVIPAQPVSGVAVPLWVAAAGVPSELAAGKEPCPLTKAFNALRNRIYPDTEGDMARYLDVAGLSDPQEGILAPLVALEVKNFERAEAALTLWRKKPPTSADVKALQESIAKETLVHVRSMLKE